MPSITVTLGELIEAEDALKRLLEVKCSAQLAYNVAKVAKAVQAETKHFHEKRDALVRELGEPVPGDTTGAIRVKSSEVPQFQQKLQELLLVETSLILTPLKLSDLPEITGADLLRLGALVTDS
jgi:hypothetical protein